MPTTSLMPVPKQQHFGFAGVPLVGGKIYTYAAGTTDPKETYSDVDGTIPQANPIVLNARGEPANAIYWSGAYKVEVHDAQDNVIYTVDNFNTDPAGIWGLAAALLASAGASLVGFIQSGVGALKRSVQSKLRDQVNVLDFGADPSGVTDSTAAIQKAIDYAQSLVAAAVDATGDPVNGCDVIMRGIFMVTEPLRVSKSNINIIGQGGTTIYPYFTGHAGYNIAKPVFIIGNAEQWQTSGSITGAIKYNRFEGIHIKTVAGYESFIGVLLSGTRNARVSNCLFERGYAGLYVENSSELLCDQTAVIGCTYGFVQDSRVNRPQASSVLNVACVDNDVSSNAYQMITAYYPAHTGFLSINAGATTINGFTCGNFSENPAPFPGLGLPPEHAGIHILGGNLKWTRGMMVNGVCFEASPTMAIDCVRIDSASSNNPVSGVSLNSCHVQTHASNYAGGAVTTFLKMVQSGTGEISNVVVRDSGFTPQTVGYYTGRMVDSVGYGIATFDGCYPNSAFATSSLGYYGSVRHVAYLEQPATNALTPAGWVYTGVTAGCSSQGGATGTPSFLHLTGDVGAITLAKQFTYRENMSEIGQPFISMLVRGNLDPVITAKVNGDAASLSSIVNGTNIARYGNAIIPQAGSGSNVLWKRVFFCFTPFASGYEFDNVLFTIGKPASAYNADFIDIRDIRIGYLVGGQMKYNPF